MRCLLVLVVTLSFGFCGFSQAENVPLYIGTGGDGIYRTQFDTTAGTFAETKKVATTQRPTFIWIHPVTDSLYSICEQGRDQNGAAIVAWQINRDTGELTMRSRQDAMGDGPCFVAVSKRGNYAAIANYGGGSVALFPIKSDGTALPSTGFVQHVGSSINQQRQSAPHAHSSNFDPTGNRVAVADLGTDKVYLYDVEADGSLTPSVPPAINMPAGSGPRHFTFSPDNKFLLVLGELSGTITSVRYAPPIIESIETISTMDADVADDAPCWSAEILFHPNGRWVYCSNRGPNQIAVFDYHAKNGKLERSSAVSCGGKHPRNFRITPDGEFLLVANQKSNNIVVFSINPDNGSLKSTGQELSIDKPMCLKFLMDKE